MEVKVIQGSKKNSEVFLVCEINEVFTKKSLNGGKIYVDCYFKQCAAKGVIFENKFYKSEENNLHTNHSIPTSSIIAKFEFYEALRNECQKVGSSLKIIFDQIYLRFKPQLNPLIIAYPNVSTSMKNWRKEKKNLPSCPKSVDDIIIQIKNNLIMQNFALQNEQFVHFVEQSCERAGKTIAFYTKSIVDLILTRGNVAGYCDGTFRFFPAYFYQLLIIHINVGNHAFACFFYLMERKSTEAYVDVFSHMSSLGIVLKELVMDFESSMRKGALCAFPNVKLSGCHFHLGQSLHKNMQKLCDHPDYSLLRKMQALALLPANIIKETYLELKGEYNDSKWKQFFKYFEKEWLKKVKPKNFSVFDSIQRTNNVCESFNSYLKNYETANINITASTNFWNVARVLLEFYEKMGVQLKDYINSDFQKKIRLSNKRTEKFQKEAVIKRLYSKLEKGMTGLQFVENVYSGDYEKLFKEVLEERNSRPEAEWNEFSDESSDEDETSLVRKCECCHNIRRIEGGFAACLHIILCRECVIKVNEHCRLSNGKVACIRCRKQNDEAKLAYY